MKTITANIKEGIDQEIITEADSIYSCSGPDLWYDGTADGNDRRGSSKEHA